MRGGGLAAVGVALTLAVPVAAAGMSPEACNRYVHTHATEAEHADLGRGLVSWRWNWTNQGIADDVHLLDCRTGRGLVARARSEGMTERLPYDRRSQAAREIAWITEPNARVFFTFERLSEVLSDVRVPSEPVLRTDEACACAAFYPELRGAKTPFSAAGAADPEGG